MGTGARPLIGITCFNETWEFDCGLWPIKAIEAAYVAGLRQAGAVAVMLTGGVDDVDDTLERLDGLVLSGGADVDPAFYGAEREPISGPADVLRDAYEIALVRHATELGLPILGICRGIQLINVALGGTLYQHVEHAVKDKPRVPVHEVAVVDGSCLASIVGASSIEVNSLHHQAVKAVAPALRASGIAPDGGVEAVESASSPLLAVQWHPEMQEEASVAPQLFSWLVGRSRAYGTSKGRLS